MPRACTICRSRRWHKDASGVVICEEGHVLQVCFPCSILPCLFLYTVVGYIPGFQCIVVSTCFLTIPRLSLQSYIPESTERTELGPHAVRKRTLKTTRRSDGDGEKEDGGTCYVLQTEIYH